jgi:hypothetical protein
MWRTWFSAAAMAWVYWFIGLLIDFSLSVVVEALILMLMKRGAARQNWLASLAANTASYLLIILPLFFVLGLLNP